MARSFPSKHWFLLRHSWPVIAMSALLLALGVSGASYVQRLQKTESRVLANHVSSILAAEQLVIVIREMRTRLNQYLLTGQPRNLNLLPSLRSDADNWLAEARRLSTDSQEFAFLDQVAIGLQEFDREFLKIQQTSPGEEKNNAVSRLASRVVSRVALRPAQSFLDHDEEQVKLSSARNEVLADRLTWGLLVVGTFGGVAGAFAGYGMARGLQRSIVELSIPIRRVAGTLNSIPGTMTISAEPGFEDLDNVMHQISQRVTAVVEQLQQSQSEALRAEQLAAVGQLAAGLAHELRNPLTSMKILIQSALAPDSNSVVDREDLAVINQEVDRLNELVESFLNFARPPQPERTRVSVLELVQPTIALVARRAAVRNILIKLQGDGPKLIVLADRSQMRQVFLNLLINAIDASPNDGEIDIQIDWPAITDSLKGPARESWVGVRVMDNGRGLPPDLGDRIFEPFVTTSQTGIGLGLSICRRIVETHGGRIDAENRSTGGAVFTVMLPLNSILRQETPVYADAAGDR